MRIQSVTNPNTPQNAITLASMTALSASLLAVTMTAEAKEDFDVGGRLMIDYAQFDGIHNDDQSGSQWYVRRARLSAEHDSGRGWEAEMELDFDEDNERVDVLEASFKYDLSKSLSVQVGKFKENFSLENSTSSLDIANFERSAATNVFSPGRNFGAALEYETTYFYGNLGVFESAVDDENKSHNALSLRGVVNPIKRDNSVVHLGISVNQRDMGGQWYEVNEPMEIDVGDKFLEGRAYRLDQLQTTAYESAFVYKRFWYQGEYFEQTLSPENDAADIDYEGYYVSVGFFLSGHSRAYKDGKFESFEQVANEQGWELVARVGQVTLLDQGLGMIADSSSLTLNYYLDENVRLMLNIAQVEVDSSNPDDVGDGASTAFRVMYKF